MSFVKLAPLVITVQEATGSPRIPTPAICTALPPGMTLLVTPGPLHMAYLEMRGLNPGEKVIILALAESNGYTSRIEEQPIRGADPTCSFAEQIGGLWSLPGSTKNQWEIQVIHSRGVACESVTLP